MRTSESGDARTRRLHQHMLRSTVLTGSGVTLVFGIWLTVAPFVLGYGDGDPYWNDIVFGAVIVVLALIRVSGAYGASWLSYLNALAGMWVFAAALWLDDSAVARWNDLVAGAVVMALALVSGATSDDLEGVDGSP
jgi:hypothetical protein